MRITQISSSFFLFLRCDPGAPTARAAHVGDEIPLIMMIKTTLLLLLAFCFATSQAQDSLSANPMENTKLLPVLWQQHAAEYRALCYQAFNFATCRLYEKKLKKNRRYAIITDVDETVLDNSYYEAKNLKENKEFESSTWKSWTSSSGATAVPGALEFLKLAHTKGVSIFYISNRDTTEVRSTVANLKMLGFPDADAGHMLFMMKISSKEERRQAVMKDYEVIMMLGDNLNDFASVFEKKDNSTRNAETDKLKNDWGKTFIVIPNAIYGEWENALYDYSRTLRPAEKEKRLEEKLVIDPKYRQVR
jgi:5'-nucleotidase (lipoprotein e(P4) family)